MGADTIVNMLLEQKELIAAGINTPEDVEAHITRQLAKAINLGAMYGSVVRGMDLAKAIPYDDRKGNKVRHKLCHLKYRTLKQWACAYEWWFKTYPDDRALNIQTDDLKKIKKFYGIMDTTKRNIVLTLGTSGAIENFLRVEKLKGVFSGLGN